MVPSPKSVSAGKKVAEGSEFDVVPRKAAIGNRHQHQASHSGIGDGTHPRNRRSETLCKERLPVAFPSSHQGFSVEWQSS